jgi:predicted lipoprotein with Yx(FWY)xxD motif
MLKTLAAGLLLSACALVALPALAATVTVAAATTAVGTTTPPAVIADSTSGKIWVNSLGMTLYTFSKDTVVGKSTCNGDCATEWPPLAVAAGAIASGDWTIVARDDGTQMWAYEGHPLYTFLDDKKAGDITGDNKDGFKVAI